jgi:hypothetical protein
MANFDAGTLEELWIEVGSQMHSLHTYPRDRHTESHAVGNLRIDLDVVSGRITEATFQVGDNRSAHRRLRLRPPAPDTDADAEAALPGALLALVEVEQRLRDGTEFDVQLTDGKVTSIAERKDRVLVRSISLEEPRWLDLARLPDLIDELLASGAELDDG